MSVCVRDRETNSSLPPKACVLCLSLPCVTNKDILNLSGLALARRDILSWWRVFVCAFLSLHPSSLAFSLGSGRAIN